MSDPAGRSRRTRTAAREGGAASSGRRGPGRPGVVDLAEFARTAEVLEGERAPAGFPRLRDLLFDEDGRVGWRIEGSRRPRPEGGADAYLELHLDATVTLRCERCLQGVETRVDESRLFKVLATEAQAERFDAESDECDALVADPRFDLLELVEDEAILALPIAPRHARCALPAGAPVDDRPDEPVPEARPNPFALLAALKKPREDDQGG